MGLLHRPETGTGEQPPRKIVEPHVDKARKGLTGHARAKRGTSSRRAQEPETRLKPSDRLAVSEFLGDLVAPEKAEASYSERMFHLSALEALVHEVSTIRNITRIEAQTLIERARLAQSAQQKMPDREPSRTVTPRMMMHLDTCPAFSSPWNRGGSAPYL